MITINKCLTYSGLCDKRCLEFYFFLFRYHNSRMINHELDRGQQVHTKFADHSTFHLPTVTRKDSGNYTCAPHNLRPASVFIHIIDEDSNSAAAAIHTAGDDENGNTVASRGDRISLLDINKDVIYQMSTYVVFTIFIRNLLHAKI